jgi:hypothetical protein
MVPELAAVPREGSGQLAVADNLARARNEGDYYYQQADQASAVGSNYYSYQKCILTYVLVNGMHVLTDPLIETCR